MDLLDIIHRTPAPTPWAEGDNIPWHEPGFSERMLPWHLSQETDAASRRSAIIERHVAWIHGELLAGKPTRVLDLACGPGLYTSRLAALGHTCLGIDYSPASIRYARERAAEGRLACTYQLEDIRTADYGPGHGFAMLIYGEPNVFRPADIKAILAKARRALAPGGLLLLEPHTFEYVERLGHEPASWYSAESGLFSARPHLFLQENSWDGTARAVTERYYVVDAATGEATRYAQSLQAYTDEEYRELLEGQGFEDVRFYPALAPAAGEPCGDFLALVARAGS